MIKCVVGEVLGVEERDAEKEVAWPWDKKMQQQATWWMCLCSQYFLTLNSFLISHLIFLSSDFLHLISLKV